MPDDSLLMLFDEVRGKTLRVLSGVSARQARWSPAGLQNSILWHAGHSYILAEWLTMEAIGREPQLPQGWFEMFSWASKPATVPPENWPTLPEVINQLLAQHRRLRPIIGGLDDAELDRKLSDGSGRSVRYCILHALHDEACHTGEIWLHRKMLNTLET